MAPAKHQTSAIQATTSLCHTDNPHGKSNHLMYTLVQPTASAYHGEHKSKSFLHATEEVEEPEAAAAELGAQAAAEVIEPSDPGRRKNVRPRMR